MDDTNTPRIADAVGLGLPVAWRAVPLAASEFDEWLANQLEELTSADVSRVDQRRFELLQRQLRQVLLSENVALLSVLTAIVDEEQDDGEGGADQVVEESDVDVESDPPSEEDLDTPGVISAGAVISLKSRDELGAPVPLSADLVLRGLATPDGDGEEPIHLDPPQHVSLPAGGAVRMAQLERITMGPADFMEFVVQTYLVPFDDGERLCTLQFVTPNIELGGSFSELFDAIAQTLRIFYPGDPTTFDVDESDGVASEAETEE